MPYAILVRGYPWVTPSLLCNKWPDPYKYCTTRVSQLAATAQIMAVWLSSLNVFHASTRINPNSSSWE